MPKRFVVLVIAVLTLSCGESTRPPQPAGTAEAVGLYRSTGDTNVLNRVTDPALLRFAGRNDCFVSDPGAGAGDRFLPGDRLYMGKFPNGFEYVLEVVYKTTNFLFRKVFDRYDYPRSFDVDTNGNIWLPLRENGFTVIGADGDLRDTIDLSVKAGEAAYFDVRSQAGKYIFGTRIAVLVYDTAAEHWTDYHIWGVSGSSTNCTIISHSTVPARYWTNYLLVPQKDRYGNGYAPGIPADGLPPVFLDINGVPAVRVFQPDAAAERFFLVQPDGTVYFRWVSDTGAWYILFRLRRI